MRSRIQIDSYIENGMGVTAVWMVAQRDAWLRATISTDGGVESVDLTSDQTQYVVLEASEDNPERPCTEYARIIHGMYS